MPGAYIVLFYVKLCNLKKNKNGDDYGANQLHITHNIAYIRQRNAIILAYKR